VKSFLKASSNKRQAASNKLQAASNKRQAASLTDGLIHVIVGE